MRKQVVFFRNAVGVSVFLMVILSVVLYLGHVRAKLTAPDPAAQQAYNTACKLLSDGKQASAESALDVAVKQFPYSQKIALFQAACVRSRFEVKEAFPLFTNVRNMDASTPEGICADAIQHLDTKQDIDASFASLQSAVEKYPNDPILLWMLAVQCRALKRNPEGIIYYRQLLTKMNPGPVLVHQTFANLLDEQGQSAEALPHRLLAVRMEPSPWSLEGLASTLHQLGRDKEAGKILDKEAALFPGSRSRR